MIFIVYRQNCRTLYKDDSNNAVEEYAIKYLISLLRIDFDSVFLYK